MKCEVQISPCGKMGTSHLETTASRSSEAMHNGERADEEGDRRHQWISKVRYRFAGVDCRAVSVVEPLSVSRSLMLLGKRYTPWISVPLLGVALGGVDHNNITICEPRRDASLELFAGLAEIEGVAQIGVLGISRGERRKSVAQLDRLEDRRRVIDRMIDEAVFGVR